MNPSAKAIVLVLSGVIIGVALGAGSVLAIYGRHIPGGSPETVPVVAPRAAAVAKAISTEVRTASAETSAAISEGSAEQGPHPAIDSGKPPKIWVEATMIDVGVITGAQVVTKELRVANQGTGALNIESVKTTCGCTSAHMDAMTIAPGAEGKLSIAIDPKRIQGGKSHKTVTLVSNDPTTPSLAIAVIAEVTPDFVIEPKTIDLGEIEKGAEAQAVAVLRQTTDRSVEVKGVTPLGAAPGVVASFETIATTERAKPEFNEYRIKASLAPTQSPGPFLANLQIQTTSERTPTASLVVKGILKAPYAVTPQVVVLQDRGNRDSKQTATVTVTGQEPIAVTDVSTSNPALLLHQETQEGPSTVRIGLSLAPETASGIKNETLTFRVKTGGKTFENSVPVRVLARFTQHKASPAGTAPARESTSGPGRSGFSSGS